MSLLCFFFSCLAYAADVDEVLVPKACGRPAPVQDTEPQQPEEDLNFPQPGFAEVLSTPCEGWNACPCEEECEKKIIAECSDALSPS